MSSSFYLHRFKKKFRHIKFTNFVLIFTNNCCKTKYLCFIIISLLFYLSIIFTFFQNSVNCPILFNEHLEGNSSGFPISLTHYCIKTEILKNYSLISSSKNNYSLAAAAINNNFAVEIIWINLFSIIHNCSLPLFGELDLVPLDAINHVKYFLKPKNNKNHGIVSITIGVNENPYAQGALYKLHQSQHRAFDPSEDFKSQELFELYTQGIYHPFKISNISNNFGFPVSLVTIKDLTSHYIDLKPIDILFVDFNGKNENEMETLELFLDNSAYHRGICQININFSSETDPQKLMTFLHRLIFKEGYVPLRVDKEKRMFLVNTIEIYCKQIYGI